VNDLDLTEYNSYKVKAMCKRAYFFDNENEVCQYFTNNSKPYIVLGSGHNIILSKPYYDEDFIIFNGNFSDIQILDNILVVESGVFTKDLSFLAYENGLA